MSKQSEELSKYIKSQRISATELAEILGITRGCMSSMLNGRYGISKGVAKQLSERFGMSQGFLITGEGSLFPFPQKAQQVVTGYGNIVQGDHSSGPNILHDSAEGVTSLVQTLTATNAQLAETNAKQQDTISRLLAMLERAK